MNFEKLAQRKIEEAIKAGEFDNLPGSGKPLPRMDGPEAHGGIEAFGYRMMARVGALPLEVMLKKEIAATRQKLYGESDPDRRTDLLKAIANLEMRFAMAMEDRRQARFPTPI